jgi:hypothetical protein
LSFSSSLERDKGSSLIFVNRSSTGGPSDDGLRQSLGGSGDEQVTSGFISGAGQFNSSGVGSCIGEQSGVDRISRVNGKIVGVGTGTGFGEDAILKIFDFVLSSRSF